MSEAPAECVYCDHTDPNCGFCEMGKPLDTQEDWDNSWGRINNLNVTDPYYEQGGITIYHGDCRDVLSSLPPESVDLLLTDPPYGIDYVSNAGTMGGISGDAPTDVDWILKSLSDALRVLRLNRHFYIFGPHDVSALTVKPTVELIWDKGKPGKGDMTAQWGPSHEKITFGTWNPYPSQKIRGIGVPARLRKGTVIRVPKINNGRGALVHPTEKPVLLMRHLIESSSTFDEIVLDPFMGAGSTLVAAVTEGRRAIGIEIDEQYCEVAAKRLASQFSSC